jgi:hypothetical protein
MDMWISFLVTETSKKEEFKSASNVDLSPNVAVSYETSTLQAKPDPDEITPQIPPKASWFG